MSNQLKQVFYLQKCEVITPKWYLLSFYSPIMLPYLRSQIADLWGNI